MFTLGSGRYQTLISSCDAVNIKSSDDMCQKEIPKVRGEFTCGAARRNPQPRGSRGKRLRHGPGWSPQYWGDSRSDLIKKGGVTCHPAPGPGLWPCTLWRVRKYHLATCRVSVVVLAPKVTSSGQQFRNVAATSLALATPAQHRTLTESCLKQHTADNIPMTP